MSQCIHDNVKNVPFPIQIICPFSNRSELKAHKQMHEDESLAGSLIRSCVQCKQVFRNSSALRMHVRIKHSKGSKKCQTCNKVFGSKTTLALHMLRHTAAVGIQYECDICGKIVCLKQLLIRHMRLHRRKLAEEINDVNVEKRVERVRKRRAKKVPSKTSNGGDKQEQCYLCPVQYSDIVTMRRHYRDHHAAKEYECICLSCNTLFANTVELYEHRTPNGAVYKCAPCGNHLSCETMHARHMEAHANKDNICEVSFTVTFSSIALFKGGFSFADLWQSSYIESFAKRSHPTRSHE